MANLGPAAALGYLAHGPVDGRPHRSQKLTLVLLYDACHPPSASCACVWPDTPASRVPGASASAAREHCRFVKDLLLQPVPGGRGYRSTWPTTELLALGAATGSATWTAMPDIGRKCGSSVQLPKLWAGFHAADAATHHRRRPGTGGLQSRERAGRPDDLLDRLRRDHHDLVLFPLAWTSHHWRQAVTVFADLAGSRGGRSSVWKTCPTIWSASRTRRSSISASRFSPRPHHGRPAASAGPRFRIVTGSECSRIFRLGKGML